MDRQRLGSFVILLLIVVVLLFTISPVSLLYVTSNSMLPTMEQGDGYIIVPSGTYTSGDIIAFESTKSSTIITHRVVDINSEGKFITKGDNNKAIDQELGRPPVSKNRVIGRVVGSGDEPLVIPVLGTALSFLSDNEIIIIMSIPIIMFIDFIISSGRSIGGKNPRLFKIVLLISLLLFGSVLSVILFTPSSEERTITATTREETTETLVTVGSRHIRVIEFTEKSFDYGYEFATVSGPHAQISTQLESESGYNVTVVLGPYDRIGPYEMAVRLYRYPPVLPPSVIWKLHSVSPILAASACSLTGTSIFLLFIISASSVAPRIRTPKEVTRVLRDFRR